LAGTKVFLLDETCWYFKTPFKKSLKKKSLAHRAVFCLCGECYPVMEAYKEKPVAEAEVVVSLGVALEEFPAKKPTFDRPPPHFDSVELCAAGKIFDEFLRSGDDDSEARCEKLFFFTTNSCDGDNSDDGEFGATYDDLMREAENPGSESDEQFSD